MAAAAIDYYRARIPVPAHDAVDLPGGIPAEGTRLSQFIYDRLLSTIIRPEGAKFILGPWVSDADCYRWSVVDEFPKIARRIDGGLLTVVGLWGKNPGEPGRGHQIVCYGYETSPQCLWVYDNNHRDQECQLVGLDPDRGVEVRFTGGTDPYRGYFLFDVIDWNGPVPPPPYVSISPSLPALPLSRAMTCRRADSLPARPRCATTATTRRA